MGLLTAQLRQVLRRLGRTPLFTAVTLVTLAVGIEANTAIFSVLDGILLKPLPYPHPEELVAVRLTAPGINRKDVSPSPADYFIFREQSRTFQDIGLYTGHSVNVTGIQQGLFRDRANAKFEVFQIYADDNIETRSGFGWFLFLHFLSQPANAELYNL